MIGYGLGDPGFESWKEQDNFLSSRALRPAVEHTVRPVQWVPVFFLEGKATGT